MENIYDEGILNELYNSLLEDAPITIDYWRDTHPKRMPCGSDRFYARLAEKIRLSVLDTLSKYEVKPRFAKWLALTLTAYLEDVKSELGVWSAFRNLYNSTYGKKLPFYEIDPTDYFDDDLNLQDVKFLIWQAYSRVVQDEDTIYFPLGFLVDLLADDMMDILVDNFDKAPVNSRLNNYIQNSIEDDDFITIRNIAEWLVLKNPLTSVPDKEDAVMQEGFSLNRTLENGGHTLPEDVGPYIETAQAAMQAETGPLGITATKYIADMARQRGLHDIAEKIDNATVAKMSVFDYSNLDDSFFYCKDALGNQYNVNKSSLGNLSQIDKFKTFTTQLVKYGNCWHVNGMLFSSAQYMPKKNVIEVENDSPQVLAFADKITKKHNGKQVFCCGDIKQVSEILDVPLNKELDEEASNYLLLLSRTKGYNLIPDMAQVITAPDNKYFDKEEAADKSLAMLLMDIPDDVAQYIAENNLLAEASLDFNGGKGFGKRLLQENLRFFFAFYRTV